MVTSITPNPVCHRKYEYMGIYHLGEKGE